MRHLARLVVAAGMIWTIPAAAEPTDPTLDRLLRMLALTLQNAPYGPPRLDAQGNIVIPPLSPAKRLRHDGAAI